LEFCKSCGGRIMPKIDESDNRVSACVDCGEIVGEGADNFKPFEDKEEKKSVQVKDDKPDDIQSLPIEKEQCSKCGNEEAYSWQRQTRSGDEPATRFYRCVKCEHTWREYS